MDIIKFKAEIASINRSFRDECADHEEEVFPIEDGPLCPEEYLLNSSFRILWLMKEPYEKGVREGNWSIPEFYQNEYERFVQQLIYGRAGRTWQPVVYTNYGILNSFKKYDDMPNIPDDELMPKILSKIAWVNIQKLPSVSGSKTYNGNIYESYEKHKDLIHKQIELLNADIIICGGTYPVVKEYFGDPDLKILGHAGYFGSKSRLVIKAHHPAQYSILREKYIDEIVECVKLWSGRKS